jgi:hypothetical protein
MKLGATTSYRIALVELQLRRRVGETYYSDNIFASVKSPNIWCHSKADVALIEAPQFDIDTSAYGYSPIELVDVADSKFFSAALGPMDVASFIGFPGRPKEPWWDTGWDMGVARTVNLASHPGIPFTNPAIKTTDVLLVSGLSFSGSSGSPVFSHEKGISVGQGFSGGNYVAAKLIGLMSGHWWNDEPTVGMFFHSGLSYLTRSTAILELVNSPSEFGELVSMWGSR